MAKKESDPLRDGILPFNSLEELEERLEMQRLSAMEDDYCNLNVCPGDCSEGVWCAGGYCDCDGLLCHCHGECIDYCIDYCDDGGGW